MKANKSHISLETAKLLKDCGIESKYVFTRIGVIDNDNDKKGYFIYLATYKLPAFTWQEIEDNAELFFGKKVQEFNDDGFQWGEWEMCAYHPIQLLLFRQQKKYEEADLYFRKNNIFINKA